MDLRTEAADPKTTLLDSEKPRPIDANGQAKIYARDEADGLAAEVVVLDADGNVVARRRTRVADAVKGWITDDGLRPRDICILTRMRPADYTETIRGALQEEDIEARVESELQDVLSEPISTIMLDALKLATRKQAPQSRVRLLDLLTDFEGGDAEAVGRELDRTLNTFVRTLREKIEASTKDEEGVQAIADAVVAFFDRNRLGTAFAQYSQGSLLDDTVGAFVKGVTGYLQTQEWPLALDSLEGLGSVPIMTMHKSKGLEYHTVVFVGLEDSALWSFANSQAEETRGFFVAFSRARKRVLFTFCHERPKYAGKPAVPQQRSQIGKLYGLLEAAGIKPEEIA